MNFLQLREPAAQTPPGGLANGSVGPTQTFPAGDGDNVSVSFQTGDDVASGCVVIGLASPVPANFCTQ